MGRAMSTDISRSNSLTDLAARIKAEHQATSDALKDSVQHAIKAGELLLEAKEQLKHGQWLPWLSEHCEISERSAQLYMRVAKNKETIEEQIRNGVADLSLNQAAALLVMTSDVRKLFAFMKELQEANPEDIVQLCIEHGVGVIKDDSYDPFAHTDDPGKRDWHLFVLFLAGHFRTYEVDGAAAHIEWVLQRQFKTPCEWLGEEGACFRKTWGMHQPSAEFMSEWNAFREEYRDKTLADIEALIVERRKQEEQEAAERYKRKEAARERKKLRLQRLAEEVRAS
jgi:hypothetical protein